MTSKVRWASTQDVNSSNQQRDAVGDTKYDIVKLQRQKDSSSSSDSDESDDSKQGLGSKEDKKKKKRKKRKKKGRDGKRAQAVTTLSSTTPKT